MTFPKNLVLAIALGLAAGACMSTEKEKPISPSESFEFSRSELADLSESALAGSAEDALKLSWFYSDQGNKDEEFFWTQVAMENGSAAGRHNYASVLVERGDARSLARAKYHLKALVEQGSKDAESLLREVESKAP